MGLGHGCAPTQLAVAERSTWAGSDRRRGQNRRAGRIASAALLRCQKSTPKRDDAARLVDQGSAVGCPRRVALAPATIEATWGSVNRTDVVRACSADFRTAES